MDSPRYRVTVTNLRTGWSSTRTHDQGWDPDDLTVRTVLTDPFSYSYSWAQDLIPGRLDPDRVDFSVWSRTAAEAPIFDLGDYVEVSMRIGTAGPYFVRPQTLKVSESEDELRPDHPFVVRTRVALVGLLVEPNARYQDGDWGGTATNTYLRWWRAQARALAFSVGIPTAWAADGSVPSAARMTYKPNREGQVSDVVEKLLNSWAPASVHHAMVARYSTVPGYAAGYQYPTVALFPTDYPDPSTALKVYVVPASRRTGDTARLPLTFVVRGGILTVTNTPGGALRREVAVSASVCDVPAVARRSRDHIINTVRLVGTYFDTGAVPYPRGNQETPSQHTESDAGSVAARGTIAREVKTALCIRIANGVPDVAVESNVPALAASFISDPTALANTLAYKDFTIRADEMPQAEAEALLPYLTPSYPGDGGDGRVVRHLTVYSLDPDAALPGARAGGFITAGKVTIEKGTIRVAVSTTPGSPIYTANQDPSATVLEFRTTAVVGVTVAEVDPSILVGDFALIDQ